MTGKDVLKLLLVSYGFKTVTITTYRGDFGNVGYEINAKNDNGECYNTINCEGLMFNIANLIRTMNEMGIEPQFNPFPSHDYPIKMILESDNLKSL